MGTLPVIQALVDQIHNEDQRLQSVPQDYIPKTVAEYFAGIGLVRLGLERAGWSVVWANDYLEQKFHMYRSYFPDADDHYNRDDIFDVDPASVPLALLATCSFPCIDLSLAGNRNGIEGKHSSAFWGFIRILRAQGTLAPPLVLLENVPGWLSSNSGEDFRITVKALNDLGYYCDAFILDARRFTPQSRLRVFLVGTKYPPPNSEHNLLSVRSSSLANDRLKKSMLANPDLKWIHLTIPEPPPLRSYGLGDEIVEEMPEDDPRWWEESEAQRHLEMMASSHRKRVEDLRHQDYWSYRTIYRRIRHGKQRAEVRKDDTAGCLRTAVGGSSRQIVVAAGFGLVRMRHMTSREYARLQGVPDDYPIEVDENQALNGFGDAVCVPAITWIAQNILNPLVEEFATEIENL